MFYTELKGPAKDARDRMVKKLWETARKRLGVLNDNDLVQRYLRPTDVDSALNPEWTFNLSATGWNTIVNNKTVADNRFIGICGVSYPQSTTQAATEIRIDRMGQTVRYWNIQDINMTENLVMYFEDPIIVEQKTPISILAYARSIGATEKIVFIGETVEKVGVLVQKGEV